MDIVTIGKDELEALIETAVTRAVKRALSPPDDVMTKADLAKYLKRSESTVNRLMKEGLPHKNARFLRSEVNRWLSDRGRMISEAVN